MFVTLECFYGVEVGYHCALDMNGQIPKEITLEFLNLHDAFLSASLSRHLMIAKSADVYAAQQDPLQWITTDHARAERMWLAFLYVLVEAWQASSLDVRTFIAKHTTIDCLEEALRNAKGNKLLDALRETRHFMCHRDKRGYWDKGRFGPIGRLSEMNALHEEFSKVFLEVFNHTRNQLRASLEQQDGAVDEVSDGFSFWQRFTKRDQS